MGNYWKLKTSYRLGHPFLSLTMLLLQPQCQRNALTLFVSVWGLFLVVGPLVWCSVIATSSCSAVSMLALGWSGFPLSSVPWWPSAVIALSGWVWGSSLSSWVCLYWWPRPCASGLIVPIGGLSSLIFLNSFYATFRVRISNLFRFSFFLVLVIKYMFFFLSPD